MAEKLKGYYISYKRMSTKIQLQGTSKARQDELLNEFLGKHQLKKAGDFIDIAKSAKSGDHLKKGAQFFSIIENAQNGTYDTEQHDYYLIIEAFDRLSRQTINKALSLFLEILDFNISIVTLFDGRVYKPNSEQLDIIQALVYFQQAWDESEKKSIRLSKAYEYKRKDAAKTKMVMTSNCPKWLEVKEGGEVKKSLNKDKKDCDKYYSIIEERAEIIKIIFEKTAYENYGAGKLINYLNTELKVPSFTGKLWGVSYIARLVNDRRLLGYYQPYQKKSGQEERLQIGDEIKDYYPKVISDTLYNAVQAARESRISAKTGIATGGRNGAFSNLFKDVSKCAYCGSNMHFKNNSAGESYLICSVASRSDRCSNKAIRYEFFIKSFFYIINKIDFSEVFNSETFSKSQVAATKDINRLKIKLDDIDKERKKISNIIGQIKDPTVLIEKLNDLGDKKKQLREEIKSKKIFISKKPENEVFIKNIADLYLEISKNNDIKKRVAINDIIKKHFSNIVFDGISKIAMAFFNKEEIKNNLYQLFEIKNNRLVFTADVEKLGYDLSFYVPTNKEYFYDIGKLDDLTLSDLRNELKVSRLEKLLFAGQIEKINKNSHNKIDNDFITFFDVITEVAEEIKKSVISGEDYLIDVPKRLNIAKFKNNGLLFEKGLPEDTEMKYLNRFRELYITKITPDSEEKIKENARKDAELKRKLDEALINK